MPQFLSQWIVKSRVIPSRLQDVVSWYLISLMAEAPKHSPTFAASISGLNKSQFSRLLSRHPDLARQTLRVLSQKICRQVSKVRRILIPETQWSILVVIDATLHRRSSLHVQNAQRFNHGEGFVIGHQWTNIVLVINDRVIPLPPIEFISRNECRKRGLSYQTEHEKLHEYLKDLKLGLWVGIHEAREVVVLMDAASGNKKILRLIHGRGWAFVCALHSNRSVRSAIYAQEAPSSSTSGNRQNGWQSVKDLFWATRKQAPWQTIRDSLRGCSGQNGNRRKEFRARRLVGQMKGISFTVALVCSEKSKGHGRIYLTCSRSDLPIRAIVLAYRRRWWIELFHRAVKNNLGLQNAGVVEFDSMVSHVHWVYCTYLLLAEISGSEDLGMEQRQRKLNRWLEARRFREILQIATRYGGQKQVKKYCQSVLARLDAA